MFRISATCALVASLFVFAGVANASTYQVLYKFRGGKDGAAPSGILVADQSGNLYGETNGGGTSGDGTIFRLTPDGAHTVLYSFRGGSDGAAPSGGLVIDASGTLYGTTYGGGVACNNFTGCGTVFEVTSKGSEKILHFFTGSKDGEQPVAGLVRDKASNLYGVTLYGGSDTCGDIGCGTIFAIGTDGSEKVLHAFLGNPDGQYPSASLIMDGSGNLYGTTQVGGEDCSAQGAVGCGTIFAFTAASGEVVLYSFCRLTDCADGQIPLSTLALDQNGNLFGTTNGGGAGKNCTSYGCGTVFELTPALVETPLHKFRGVNIDGAFPVAGVTLDGAGNLIGSACGSSSVCQSVPGKTCPKGCSNGDAYSIGPVADGKAPVAFQVLHVFNGIGGAAPKASALALDGSFYGTTAFGGNKTCSGGCGVVFRITP